METSSTDNKIYPKKDYRGVESRQTERQSKSAVRGVCVLKSHRDYFFAGSTINLCVWGCAENGANQWKEVVKKVAKERWTKTWVCTTAVYFS